MNGEKIRQEIQNNNEKIYSLLDPETFVLNSEVKRLMERNKQLRAICEHEYNQDGFCIYCNIKKEE